MAGSYVVNVYVQASDNTTVTKTYNYTASADGPIPTNPPTQPSTGSDPGYQKGDANMDGKVDIKDATYVQMYVAKYEEAKTIIVSVADMSGDGVITVLDATLIQRELIK